MKVVLFAIAVAGILIVLGAVIQKEVATQLIKQCDERFGRGNWTLLPKKTIGMSVVYECVQKGKELYFCSNVSSLSEECFKNLGG